MFELSEDASQAGGEGRSEWYEILCDEDGCSLMTVGLDGTRHLICEYPDRPAADARKSHLENNLHIRRDHLG